MEAGPHIRFMENFDFDAPAELYVLSGRMGRSGQNGARGGRMSYFRFGTAAEAIRYAMEVLEPQSRAGGVVETEEARLGAAEIRQLYESASYKLPRSATL